MYSIKIEKDGALISSETYDDLIIETQYGIENNTNPMYTKYQYNGQTRCLIKAWKNCKGYDSFSSITNPSDMKELLIDTHTITT